MSSSTTGTVDVTGSVGANPIEATAPHPGESLEAEKEEASKSKGKRKASKEKRSGKKSKSSKSSKGVFGTAPVEASTAGSAQEVLPAHEPDNPEMCMVGAAQLRYLASDFAVYRLDHPMGDGYRLNLPHDESTCVTKRRDVRGYFGCYRAALDMGLRFPINPFVWDILEKYNIGLWQLTPNSWANIFGYLATCNIKGFKPDFCVFANMHSITKHAASCDGWFVLSTLPGYSVVVNKSSKWNNWKQRFYVMKTVHKDMAARFNMFNAEPLWLGKDPHLERPPVDPRLADQLEYFQVKKIALGTKGDKMVVPCKWVPDARLLLDHNFQAFSGINSDIPRGITVQVC